MLLRAMMLLLISLGAAQAQDAGVPAADGAAVGAPVVAAVGVAADAPVGAAALIDAMPAKRLKAMKTSPAGFLEDAAEVIYAAGRDGRIDAAGVEAFIALRRAEARARWMAQFLGADLDNDGAIGRDEISLFAGSLIARRRGEIHWGYDLADADVDGSVTMAELRSHGQTVALNVLDDIDAAGLRSLMLFDLDKDGVVAMDEMVSTVSALAEQ